MSTQQLSVYKRHTLHRLYWKCIKHAQCADCAVVIELHNSSSNKSFTTSTFDHVLYCVWCALFAALSMKQFTFMWLLKTFWLLWEPKCLGRMVSQIWTLAEATYGKALGVHFVGQHTRPSMPCQWSSLMTLVCQKVQLTREARAGNFCSWSSTT